ncbi:MAG: SdrD B-like domain-containing protein [Planctomycetota bacterium]
MGVPPGTVTTDPATLTVNEFRFWLDCQNLGQVNCTDEGEVIRWVGNSTISTAGDCLDVNDNPVGWSTANADGSTLPNVVVFTPTNPVVFDANTPADPAINPTACQIFFDLAVNQVPGNDASPQVVQQAAGYSQTLEEGFCGDLSDNVPAAGQAAATIGICPDCGFCGICNGDTGGCDDNSTTQCPDNEFCANVVCNETTDLCDTTDISTSQCPDNEFCANVVCNETTDVCDTTDISTSPCSDVSCNETTDMCDTACLPDGRSACEITIGDCIWLDEDGDGIQDPAEPGISDVDLTLVKDCNGTTSTETTTTNGDGTQCPTGFGGYSFTVPAVDANCDPAPRDLKVTVDASNFTAGMALEGLSGSPGPGSSAVANDSDCDPTVNMTVCEAFPAGTNNPNIDCGFVRPPEEAICRTPGFWGARAGDRRDCQNITQAVIDANGGSISVCGETITDTSTGGVLPGDLSSALEAVCVRVQGVPERQLYRQLTAAALNCVVSGDPSCALIPLQGVTWADCNMACSGMGDPADIQSCISQIDCWNNGGTYGPLGCDESQEDINSCHTRSICESPNAALQGLCPLRCASSPDACREARGNSCTIDSCP